MQVKQRLGDMLIQADLIDAEQLHQALSLQRQAARPLGFLLIKMGLVAEEDLQRVLAEQLEVPIIDIETEFSPQVKKIVPRSICKFYSVLPLSLDKNNVLKLAMIDPSDREAVSAIEKISGKIIVPMIALKSAIENNIASKIPWTLKDLFYGKNSIRTTAVIATCSIILIGGIAGYLYYDKTQTKQGSITHGDHETIYKHHELTLSFSDQGKVSLLGRGAHAESFYSITFDNVKSFQRFLEHKQKDFSGTQLAWLAWAVDNQAQSM
jgi:hypothetical protein